MRIPLITCSTLLLFFFVQTVQAQSFLADYKLKWKNAAEYTLEFAQAMPEDQYGYKPVPAEM
ncbi:MAG: hypothetical protein WBB31_04775, partial [Saprospiraceae bacterium]